MIVCGITITELPTGNVLIDVGGMTSHTTKKESEAAKFIEERIRLAMLDYGKSKGEAWFRERTREP